MSVPLSIKFNSYHSDTIKKQRTADFQMTRGIRNIIANEGNKDDLIAFILDRYLPLLALMMKKLHIKLLKF